MAGSESPAPAPLGNPKLRDPRCDGPRRRRLGGLRLIEFIANQPPAVSDPLDHRSSSRQKPRNLQADARLSQEMRFGVLTRNRPKLNNRCSRPNCPIQAKKASISCSPTRLGSPLLLAMALMIAL